MSLPRAWVHLGYTLPTPWVHLATILVTCFLLLYVVFIVCVISILYSLVLFLLQCQFLQVSAVSGTDDVDTSDGDVGLDGLTRLNGECRDGDAANIIDTDVSRLMQRRGGYQLARLR